MIDKLLVTSAFQKLGPERVEQGLRASGTLGWYDCFLACAYGGYGELFQDSLSIAQHPEPGSRDMQLACALAFGLSDAETWAVVAAFDLARAELRALAEEWLEQNRVRPDQAIAWEDLDVRAH
ncbi:MAG TPA: hypothetical protein VNL18_15625 [Gemmatimonadales bacterium]|nr:hypothetical protein [Gemmatimonadales bacterium]